MGLWAGRGARAIEPSAHGLQRTTGAPGTPCVVQSGSGRPSNTAGPPSELRPCPLFPLPCLPQRWVSELGYRDLVTFKSTDSRGGTVYHTNVMMAVGTDVAVVCLESVEDEKERRRLKEM